MKFIEDAREWTSRDPDNVIAIHCKGGKGRTGTVVCSWLIDQGKFNNAKVTRDRAIGARHHQTF